MILSLESIKKRMIANGAVFPMAEMDALMFRGVGPLAVERLKQEGLIIPSFLDGLSNRAVNCLTNMNITNKAEAVKAVQDRRIRPGRPRNFGNKTYQEVRQWAGATWEQEPKTTCLQSTAYCP